MSDMQSGVFYPPSVLFFLLPFPFSFNGYILFHFFVAFYFFYLFIRAHGLSSGAALIGAIAYTYGGFTISSVNTLNNLSASVWLPAVLWAHQEAVQKRSVQGFFLVTIFLSLSLLGGEPQIFAMGAALLVLSVLTSGGSDGPRGPIKQALIATALCLAAVTVAMVQIGPTWTDFQFSARSGGISFDDAAQHSLDPGRLANFLFPLRFTENFVISPESLTHFFPGGSLPWLLTIYSGFLTCPLAVAGIFNGPIRRRRWRIMWVCVFVIGLILSLGRHTPAFLLFYKLLPIFRFPEKFVYLCSFALSVLAAEGIDAMGTILTRTKARVAPVLVVALMAVAMTADLYTQHRYLNPIWESTDYERRHPLLQPIVNDKGLFRVFIDGQNLAPSLEPETILSHHARWQAFWMPNLGMIHHIDHVGGRTGLELRHQYLITELLAKPWAEKLVFLRMANVRYIVSGAPLDREPALTGHITRINPLVFRLDTALPRAWLVGNLRPLATGRLNDLHQAGFDPAVTALTPEPFDERFKRPSHTPVTEIRYNRPNRIHVTVDTPEPAVLVVSESAYPGWRVQVDGDKRPGLWLNLFFQGVVLESGRHEVVFFFRPRYFSAYAGISAAALALMGLSWMLAIYLTKQPFLGTRE
ncbi:MAG: YfhO family protein [Pseudomonadota bacterium]